MVQYADWKPIQSILAPATLENIIFNYLLLTYTAYFFSLISVGETDSVLNRLVDSP